MTDFQRKQNQHVQTILKMKVFLPNFKLFSNTASVTTYSEHCASYIVQYTENKQLCCRYIVLSHAFCCEYKMFQNFNVISYPLSSMEAFSYTYICT